jgi:hypothetical protein
MAAPTKRQSDPEDDERAGDSAPSVAATIECGGDARGYVPAMATATTKAIRRPAEPSLARPDGRAAL